MLAALLIFAASSLLCVRRAVGLPLAPLVRRRGSPIIDITRPVLDAWLLGAARTACIVLTALAGRCRLAVLAGQTAILPAVRNISRPEASAGLLKGARAAHERLNFILFRALPKCFTGCLGEMSLADAPLCWWQWLALLALDVGTIALRPIGRPEGGTEALLAALGTCRRGTARGERPLSIECIKCVASVCLLRRGVSCAASCGATSCGAASSGAASCGAASCGATSCGKSKNGFFQPVPIRTCSSLVATGTLRRTKTNVCPQDALRGGHRCV